jgi:hypothetical protein
VALHSESERPDSAVFFSSAFLVPLLLKTARNAVSLKLYSSSRLSLRLALILFLPKIQHGHD